MGRVLAAVLLGAAFVAATAGTSSQTQIEAAVGDSYIVYRPPGLPKTEKAPLVVVLGRPPPGKIEVGLTGFNALADKGRFLVAYAGISRSYNDQARKEGIGSRPLPDVQFVNDVIDEVRAGENVDPDRVYVTGVSSSGTLSFRVGCELADKVAAIGPIAAYLTVPGCKPNRPVSLLLIYGTADTAVPADQVAASAELWRKADGCPATSVTTSNTAVTTEIWSKCRGGSEVTVDAVQRRGHGWPRGTSYDATPRLWAFFAAHAAARISVQAPPSIRVAGRRSTRLVAVQLRVDESLVVRISLLKGRKVLAMHTYSPPMGQRTLRLKVPRGTTSGRYLVKVLIRNKQGDARLWTRRIRLPR